MQVCCKWASLVLPGGPSVEQVSLESEISRSVMESTLAQILHKKLLRSHTSRSPHLRGKLGPPVVFYNALILYRAAVRPCLLSSWPNAAKRVSSTEVGGEQTHSANKKFSKQGRKVTNTTETFSKHEDTFSKQPGHSHKQERHIQKTADMTLKTDLSTFSKQRGHSRTLAIFRLQMWSCICFVACLCGLSDLERRTAGVGRRIAIKGCMFSKEAVGTGTAGRSSRNICSSAARGRLDSWRVAAPPPLADLKLSTIAATLRSYPLPGSIRDLTSMRCCKLENQLACRSHCEFKSIQRWQRKTFADVDRFWCIVATPHSYPFLEASEI